MNHAARTISVIKACGLIAVAGCILVSLADVVGVIIVSLNPISASISKLAIGEYAWIQDLGLDAYALGVFALAVGLFLQVRGDGRWHTGLLLLLVLGIDIILIAEHNQYTGRPERGVAIHIYLVYALYALVAVIPLFLARGLKRFGRHWRVGSLVMSGLWLVLAPFFFFVPDSVDGAYERFLALFLVLSVGGAGWKLIRVNRASED